MDKKSVFISIAAAAAATVIAKLAHPVFSAFELIFIFYFIGCVMYFCLKVKKDRSQLNVISFMKLSFFIMMGVAGYSTMTYGQANIHGDAAIATMLARAEVAHRTLLPKTWCYANGDIWILDTQLAVLPFTLLMKDQAAARMLGTLVMIVIGIAGMYLLDRYLLKRDAYLVSLPVILVFMFGGDGALGWGNGHINYQASYTCWLFFIPVFCILVYHLFILETKSKALMAIYFVLASACIARGVRAIAEIMIPLFIAYSTYMVSKYGDMEIKKWRKWLLFLAPMLLGCLLYKIICITHTVNTSVTSGTVFTDSLYSVFFNAKEVLINMFKVFGYNEGAPLASIGGAANMVSITCCLLLVFCIPFLELRHLGDEDDGVRFFIIFCTAHNAEMAASTILFDKISQSHILTFVIVSIMMSSVYVMRYWIGNKRYAFVYGGLFLTASLIMAAQLGYASRGWQGRIEERRATAEVMLEHGLKGSKGYGSFWNIYPLGIYSDLSFDVAAIGNSDIGIALTPHLNLVDTDKFIPAQSKSFLLLDYNENQELGGDLEEIFGECMDKFNVGENYIYVWDYDVAANDFGGRPV